MSTFRADIDVEEIESVAKKRNLVLFWLILFAGILAAAYVFTRAYLL